jgi:hydrogenase-4 component F
MLLYAIILAPLVFALAAAFIPSRRYRPLLVPAAGFVQLALVLQGLVGPPIQQNDYLVFDPLGRLILLVVSLLFAVSSVYSIGYFRQHPEWPNKFFIVCLLIFLSTMSLATMAWHLGLLWVAVEATTVVSAPLIYYNRNRFSIEATWKYLMLCSIGIALALLGILFVAYADLQGAGTGVLQFDQMLAAADSFSKPWLRVGYIFLLVGFGTKMGLAPLHSWKPDAYGEAPGLVGGLLAGGLTSVSFLAILRILQIMGAAGELQLAHQALLALGVVSLVFAAFFVVRQRDIKRMLAYSSVEHMGLLAIGVSIGGLATFGAMFHVLNNALVKGVLFMTAGNMHRFCGSKRVCEMQGSLKGLPFSSALFLAGFLAISGSPPFGPFMSEFTMLRGVFGGGHYLLGGTVLVLLAVIFIGMANTVTKATMGTPQEDEQPDDAARYKDTMLTVAPPLALLTVILCLGLWLPDPLRQLFTEAVAVMEGVR